MERLFFANKVYLRQRTKNLNKSSLNLKLKSYLIILTFLVVGILVVGIAQLLKLPDWLNPAFVVLGLFIILNIATSKIFNLTSELKIFWSFKKIYFLPIGFVAGGLIAVTPTLAGLLLKVTHFSQLKLNATFTLPSILLTLVIVAWEELWFRGIFLNYCNQNLSPVPISITVGSLFALVHLLNPEIDLLQTGPTLFFAGAFLTILYFYFKTIWLPIGVHFGNNYLTIGSDIDNHCLFGKEGYFGAIIIGILFLAFVRLTLNRTRKNQLE